MGGFFFIGGGGELSLVLFLRHTLQCSGIYSWFCAQEITRDIAQETIYGAKDQTGLPMYKANKCLTLCTCSALEGRNLIEHNFSFKKRSSHDLAPC